MKKNGIWKDCTECHKKFYVKLCLVDKIARCSRVCSSSFRKRTFDVQKMREMQKLSMVNRIYPDSRKLVVCIICKKHRLAYQSNIGKYTNYCSRQCWYSDKSRVQKPTQKILSELRKGRQSVNRKDPEFRRKLSNSIKEGYRNGTSPKRLGANNNFWKGGIATLQNKLRQTPAYEEWRKAIYKRDNYICQHCGTNKDLHAHHIKTFSKYPDLRYEVDNGITVCRPCHSKIHGRYLPDISKANKKGVYEI